MKTLFSPHILSVALMSTSLFFIGCDSSNEPQQQTTTTQETTTAQEATTQQDSEAQPAQVNEAELKSGNVFSIARDVADVQLKAGNYISQLQQSQESLQQAIEAQDIQQLESTVTALKGQLTGFNDTLSQLNLKSTEINDIRQNIMTANQQALASPLLNGQVDFSKVDFNMIEQQLGTVQSEMIKLAGLMIPQSADTNSEKEAAE